MVNRATEIVMAEIYKKLPARIFLIVMNAAIIYRAAVVQRCFHRHPTELPQQKLYDFLKE